MKEASAKPLATLDSLSLQNAVQEVEEAQEKAKAAWVAAGDKVNEILSEDKKEDDDEGSTTLDVSLSVDVEASVTKRQEEESSQSAQSEEDGDSSISSESETSLSSSSTGEALSEPEISILPTVTAETTANSFLGHLIYY